jgi:hypothetical protein
MTWDAVQYTGMSDRALSHHTVEDEMKLAVGIRLL